MNETTYGWQSGPDGRGTLDIVQSCCFTIFLCCWTSLCTNLGALDEGPWHQLCDKYHLACLGILGPEFLFILAVGQWSSARENVKAFRELGYDRWTLTHAFFADMGGFVFQPRDWVSFPVNAKQLLYLVEHGYVEMPILDADDIEDRNKTDGLARLITACQVIWFSINCLFRGIQHLHLTTLELTTLAFIACSLPTSLCWRHKPTDIRRPTILRSNASIVEILQKAGNSAVMPYQYTPLDFVSRKEWLISILWAHDQDILRRLRLPLFSRPIKSRPINRIPNDNWPQIEGWPYAMVTIITIIYCAIFIMGWNFHFPTQTEQLLWRIAAVGTPVVVLVLRCFEFFDFRWVTQVGPSEVHADKIPSAELPRHRRSRYERWAADSRNPLPNKDPAMGLRLWPKLCMTCVCALYSVFRAYILIQDVISLRALPASAFETVEWSKYIPHV